MAQGTELSGGGASIARLQTTRRVSDAVAELLSAYDQLRDGLMARRISDAREGLARVKAMNLAAIAADIERGRAAATPLEIEAAVGQLIGCTKHLNKVDGPLFHETLSEFIQQEKPTRLGLADAVRKVILSAKFTPSIAEVIETLRAVESDLRSARQRLEWLPDHVKAAEEYLNGAVSA